ncbi:hypothetical protein [Thiohalorhabdus sp.]|uniref:hypothetical protein n=1 Tax=Thiohalorhabdus sp. TaxID=3094134 RepID=UPI002FC37CD0
MIEVNAAGGNEFEVTVNQGGAPTKHRVGMSPQQQEKLCPGRSPEECLEAAFRFLLDREPAQAILGQFDVMVIAKYFPEFESKIGDYL